MPEPADVTGSWADANWRILIVDNVVSNAGDAAIIVAMKQSLESAFGPGTHVVNCYCGSTADPGVYAEFYPELNFIRTLWHCEYDWSVARWNLWGRLVRMTSAQRFVLQARLHRGRIPLSLLFRNERALFHTFAESDVVVVTGGAPLCTSWTMASIRRHRVAQYRAARLLRKPLVFYSQSFGPFTAEDNLPRLLQAEVQNADLVLCRDEPSLQVVRNVIGADGPQILLSIDEALLLEPRPASRPLAPAKRASFRLGLCVHQWNWLGEPDASTCQRDFESRISAVCTRLLRERHVEIVFLTSHQRIPGAMHTDEDVSERVAAGIPETLRQRTHIVRGFVHPREFSSFMGDCDAVLSSRLHGAILSLIGGAPTIALEYEPKTRGLMRQMGVEEWVLSMRDSSAADIHDAVASLLDRPDEASRRRREAVAAGRQIAANSARSVFETVRERVRRHKTLPQN